MFEEFYSMHFIDTHTHIYLPEFNDDRNEMMQRTVDANVKTTILPAIDSSTHEMMMAVASAYENCFSMIGLHPCSVNQNFEQEMELINQYLTQHKFIAIGETGLDFYWDKTFTSQQYKAFHQQIEIALKHHLPIVIHSRSAIDECIEVVSQHAGIKGVFHCFSGNEIQAEKILNLGFMLGIGGVITFKNSGLDKIIESIGLSKVILETDAPYLTPAPHRGKRNEPSYLPLIAHKLATLCHCSINDVAQITTQNAKNLFKLS